MTLSPSARSGLIVAMDAMASLAYVSIMREMQQRESEERARSKGAH